MQPEKIQKMQQRTSDIIRFMRLPLAIAIVFQHSYGLISSARPADADALLPLEGVWLGIAKPLIMFHLCLFYFRSATWIVEHKPWKTPEMLSRASVPVYAGHMGLGVLNTAAGWVSGWIPDTSCAWLLGCRYFLAPTLCIVLIVAVFAILYPSILATILSGTKPSFLQKKG